MWKSLTLKTSICQSPLSFPLLPTNTRHHTTHIILLYRLLKAKNLQLFIIITTTIIIIKKQKEGVGAEIVVEVIEVAQDHAQKFHRKNQFLIMQTNLFLYRSSSYKHSRRHKHRSSRRKSSRKHYRKRSHYRS